MHQGTLIVQPSLSTALTCTSVTRGVFTAASPLRTDMHPKSCASLVLTQLLMEQAIRFVTGCSTAPTTCPCVLIMFELRRRISQLSAWLKHCNTLRLLSPTIITSHLHPLTAQPQLLYLSPKVTWSIWGFSHSSNFDNFAFEVFSPSASLSALCLVVNLCPIVNCTA